MQQLGAGGGIGRIRSVAVNGIDARLPGLRALVPHGDERGALQVQGRPVVKLTTCLMSTYKRVNDTYNTLHAPRALAVQVTSGVVNSMETRGKWF